MSFDDLESMFSAKSAKKVTAEAGAGAGPKKEEKAKKVSVIDAKKANAVAIMLGSLCSKQSPEEIRDKILAASCSPELVSRLCINSPDAEDKKQLDAYTGSSSDLARPDAFFLVINEIPMLRPRLKAMLYQQDYEEKVASVNADLRAVIVASEALLQSDALHKCMQIILMVGNYMNSGGYNAQSHGFRISFLNKLRNTKTRDNKSTLLRYIANLLRTKSPEVFKVYDHLACTSQAKGIALSALNAEIAALSAGNKQLQTVVDACKSAPTPLTGDKFAEKFEPFTEVCGKEVALLISTQKQMTTKFSEACTFFGEDPKDIEPMELFGIFAEFMKDLQNAEKENLKSAEDKRKAEAREREMAEKEKRKKKKKPGNRRKTMNLNENSEDKGIMDDLVAELSNGSAFGRQRRRKGGGGATAVKEAAAAAAVDPDEATAC